MWLSLAFTMELYQSEATIVLVRVRILKRLETVPGFNFNKRNTIFLYLCETHSNFAVSLAKCHSHHLLNRTQQKQNTMYNTTG